MPKAKTRITTKQRAARVRNIEVARRAKKAGTGRGSRKKTKSELSGIDLRNQQIRRRAKKADVTGRGSRRFAKEHKAYGIAFSKEYSKRRGQGLSKKMSRLHAAEFAMKKEPRVAVKKISARVTHASIRKGYGTEAALFKGNKAAYIAVQSGVNLSYMLHVRGVG